MTTIDPDIRSNRKRQEVASSNDRTGVGVYADAEIGQMRAVRQKKEDLPLLCLDLRGPGERDARQA